MNGFEKPHERVFGYTDAGQSWDGEQIVRCRDCKYYADHEWVIATDVSDVCHFWADGVKVEPNGFCKWGKPRFEQ